MCKYRLIDLKIDYIYNTYSKTDLAETTEIMDKFSFNDTEEKEWWSKK